MIISEHGKYKDKKKEISELTPMSNYKVEVECPKCHSVRETRFSSLTINGHHFCRPCKIKMDLTKIIPLETRFGRLVVIDKHQTDGKVLCKCDCGTISYINKSNLKQGMTNSCGCLKKESFKNTTHVKGSRHGMWKGGISRDRERFMQTSKYRQWRDKVYLRDNYTCQACGQVGYELNAHHIKPYADNKHLRTDIDNGITLCKECHIKFHSLYGRLNNDDTQIEEFKFRIKESEIYAV